MQKPNSLRKALTDAVPVLRTNPDMLCLRLDDGNNTATLARSLSFEKRYTLNIVVTDFTDDIDLLFVPIMAAASQSAGHHDNRRGEKKGFAWYADINNDSSLDVSISLLLTERTTVKEADGAMYVENIPEPPPPEPVTRLVEMWSNGELVSKWDE